MGDLPQPAIDHLYAFLLLGASAVAAIIALVSAVNKGRAELRTMMRDQIREAYSITDDGKPGVAAAVTLKIVTEAFSSNLDHLAKAIRDVELVQQDLADDLKEHERREFERGDARDRELKTEVSRTIETALRYPKELASQYQIVRATVDAHGRELEAHEHRLRVLEAKP